jgi:NADH-quinone oxidoreductase subunit G
MVALRDLMKALGVSNFESRGETYDASERCGYLFNTTIAGLEQADAILLVGTNPRWEAAMVNARIRKAWRNKRTKIALIGAKCDLNYPYAHIGTGPADLEALLAGKGDFAAVLQKAERPVIIVGEGAFMREDGAAIQALVCEIAEKFNMVREGWNGFNVLHRDAGRVGALDIGFWSKPGAFDLGAMELVYLLGADCAAAHAHISDKAFVIYQGHHGDAGAARADVILPGAAYTEKSGLYVNTEGRVQQARFAVDPPGLAREDWKIVRALAEKTGVGLAYNSYAELRGRIEKEWPHMGVIDAAPVAQWKKFGSKDKLLKDSFKAPVENFYLANIICKASPTMRKCTEAFVNGTRNQQEAAE